MQAVAPLEAVVASRMSHTPHALALAASEKVPCGHGAQFCWDTSSVAPAEQTQADASAADSLKAAHGRHRSWAGLA